MELRSSMVNETSRIIGDRLNARLQEAGMAPLDAGIAGRFGDFFALLERWNARTNLTSIRDEQGILSRHFVESIVCARALPAGVATLLDFGSGAGFPGIPIALCRPEIAVTLAESQGKKGAFLREAVRTLGLGTVVHSGRAELLHDFFDCVTLRAVDRMTGAVLKATERIAPRGWLALMTTDAESLRLRPLIGGELQWAKPIQLAGSDQRMLALAQRAGSPVV